MMRVIVNPAVLPPEALAELKEWLGITTTLDDAPLSSLLAAALDVCTDFTGMVPLTSVWEETLGHSSGAYPCAHTGRWMQPMLGHHHDGWLHAATRPVQQVNALYVMNPDGSRTALDPASWQAVINPDGTLRIRLVNPAGQQRLVVNFTAGMATSWAQLPQAIHHGIIRLAAHQHRTREADGAAPLPPASVAALWRPWRQVRLA